MYFRVLLIILLVLNLSGCATQRKSQQIQDLQARVGQLENELKDRQDKIDILEMELEKTSKEMFAGARVAKKSEKTSYKKTSKNIQIALRNAQFYNGPIDGKIGKNTKNAIKEFQKRKGLNADGVVGKNTWAELKKFLQ